MTVTDRTAATEQEFRDRIAPFEDAPLLPESWEGSNALADHFENGFVAAPVREAAVLEEVARAMWDADGFPADLWEGYEHTHYRILAAAAVAAYRAQDGGAEEARDRELIARHLRSAASAINITDWPAYLLRVADGHADGTSWYRP
jgi:hypothetical protein